MKPIILITASLTEEERFLKLDRAYTKSVQYAGGVPVIADYAGDYEQLLSIADGVLFSGGVDVMPDFFGEEPLREIGESTPLRDAYELKLFKAAMQMNKRILGICRGAQLINVGLGGKLFQDIYCQVENPLNHNQKAPKKYASHSVTVCENSMLGNIVKNSEIKVNSFHHQAVSILGDGLIITARAADGVIEAFEHKKLPFIMGVQWHPEQMTKSVHQNIFSAFINGC